MIKLDKKNNLLIATLLNNCRLSNAQIGKKIGLSREVVAYRIVNLEKEGIITSYTADINFNKLGFSAYSISMNLQNLSNKKEEKIAEYLRKNKKVVYLQKTLSKYNFVFTLLVKSIQELSKETENIREFIGNNLKKIEVDIFLGDYDFSVSFFKKTSSEKKEINFFDIPHYKVKLDEKDRRLLEILVENSRISAVEISKKIKLSVFTVAHRIKRLVKERIILAFRPIIDMGKLGYHRYTLLLNISKPNIEENLINFCRNHKLIWDMGKYTGNYNYAIEVFGKNNEEFKLVIDDIMNQFSSSIISYETLIVLHELKHKYFFD